MMLLTWLALLPPFRHERVCHCRAERARGCLYAGEMLPRHYYAAAGYFEMRCHAYAFRRGALTPDAAYFTDEVASATPHYNSAI